MNILAFDTCFGACSAAVGRAVDGACEQISKVFELRDTGHAEVLMPMIADVMAKAGLGFDEIDRIAVTNGPGSFTGTRISVSAARAFALATRASVIGASSLAVMAEEAAASLQNDRADAMLAVAVDARRGQVYAQHFGKGGLDPLTQPAILGIPEAARIGGSGPIVFVGSGAQEVADAAVGFGRDARAALLRLQPDAGVLLRMAPKLPHEVGLLHPIYLREADAKPPSGQTIARL